MSKDPQKDPLKLLLLGDSTVGKTCFYLRYSTGLFNSDHVATIGVDYFPSTITLPKDNTEINIRLWDTAGQDRFKAITKNYIRGAHGVFIVYDITIKKTFENVTKWIASTKDMNIVIPIVLIGNKCDCKEEDRQVTKEQGEQLAKELNIPFYEASAKENINVMEAMITLTENAYSVYSTIIQKENEFRLNNKKKNFFGRCC